jgi:hypothetical protein
MALLEAGLRKVEGGRWKVEGGRWKVEGGRWKERGATKFTVFAFSCSPGCGWI